MKITLGLLSSRIRLEEKLLVREAEERPNLDLEILNPTELVFELGSYPGVDVLIDREISQSRAYHILELFSGGPVPIINSFQTVRICGDKVMTSRCLAENGVPTPDIRVAFDRRSALDAAEELGYPVVLKPVDGSWGRLIGKITNRENARALFEHKSHLSSHFHSIFYLQEFVEKPERDIRAYVVGDQVIGAVYRVSDHWITNASRGGKASPCPITQELEQICLESSRAVGGGALAVDLFETKDGFTVNEINCSMEFKESMKAMEANPAQKLIDYAISRAESGNKEETPTCLT